MAQFKSNTLFLPFILFFFLLSVSISGATKGAPYTEPIPESFPNRFEQFFVRNEVEKLLVNFNDDFNSGQLIGNATCMAKERLHGIFTICYLDTRNRPAYTLDNVTLDPAIADADLKLEVFCPSFARYKKCLEKYACESCGPASTLSSALPCQLHRSKQWNICDHPTVTRTKRYLDFASIPFIVLLVLLLLFVLVCAFRAMIPCPCRRGADIQIEANYETSHSDLE